MKVLYAVDFDETRTPCMEYYYELPENLDGEIELKEVDDLWNNDWCRRLVPTDEGVRGEGFEGEDTDWYYEHIAKMSREELAALDRKVWEAMSAIPGILR